MKYKIGDKFIGKSKGVGNIEIIGLCEPSAIAERHYRIKVDGSIPVTARIEDRRLLKHFVFLNPLKCDCGAKYSSNPNYHQSYCSTLENK